MRAGMEADMKKSKRIKLIIILAVILVLGSYAAYLFIHYFNYMEYRKYLKGIVSGEFAFGDTLTDVSNFVAIYGMPSDKLAEMRNDPLIRGKVKEVPEAKTWIKRKLKENTDIAITQPDHLYALLRQSKVKYAILASLRLNPNVNTGDIITTLHRYLYFIQLKYPDALQEVKRIGEDEPSSLIEIKLD
jgi:hypothetical protein